jgi:hypothetical protein
MSLSRAAEVTSPAFAPHSKQPAHGCSVAVTRRAALWSEIDVRLIEHFRACPALAARLAEIEAGGHGGCTLPQTPPAPWSRPFSASGDLPHLAARD